MNNVIDNKVNAEIAKLMAETTAINRKLQPEIEKMAVEVSKFMAETKKVGAETAAINKKDRWYGIIALVGLSASLMAALTPDILAAIKAFMS